MLTAISALFVVSIIFMICFIPGVVLAGIIDNIHPGLMFVNDEWTPLGTATLFIGVIIVALLMWKGLHSDKYKMYAQARAEEKQRKEQYELQKLTLENEKTRQQIELKKLEAEKIKDDKIYQLGAQQAERKKMTTNLKKFILERDDYTCQHCGASLHNNLNLKLEVDHIVPISQGGKTDPSNLQTLCQACNRSKGAKSMTEFQKKKKVA